MQNFIYNTPTKVFFGKGKEKEVGEIISSYGYKKIMLQYGMGSVIKSGLLEVVRASLKNNGIEVVEMGGVEPNPKVTFVRNAVKIAKSEKVELILAVGGGSVIDSSKFTALGVKTDCDVWDVAMGKCTVTDALPVGCILTMSAAGSEMSSSAVITNLELNMKKGLGSELNRCKFAICNPELTFTVSPYQTACGIVDIMAHTIERYFTNLPDTLLTDMIAESVLKAVIEAGRVVMANPCDYDARATIMWASSLSHNGLTACGRENYLAVHQLEHALSGEYDSVAHGAGLAVLMPAWAKYVYTKKLERFAKFARNVWGVNETDDKRASELGIIAMENYFEFLNMPSKLSEFGVTKDKIDKLCVLTTFNNTRTIKNYIELGYNEVKDIFTSCI